MDYIISWNGQQVCVGLIKEQGSNELINFAHNTFKSYNYSNLFHGALNFKNVKQFWKCLVLQDVLPKLMDKPDASKEERKSFFKSAFDNVRHIRDNKVIYDNFMAEIRQVRETYALSRIPRDWDNPEGY